MSKPLIEPRFHRHDGTSQAGRALPALDPRTVPVDGRGIDDLLRYFAGLGKGLQYFGLDNQAAGDWSALISDEPGEVERMVAFLADPERFDAGTAPELFAPHRVLLLTFLELLQDTQVELNTLGRRHLDYYYHQVLGFEPRPAEPDRVKVLFELEADCQPIEVEAGTLLDAGQDSSGEDLVYSTERDLVVSQAQIAQLSSLYVDYRITGFPEAREDHFGDPAAQTMALFELALGEPHPGDPLPPYSNAKLPMGYALLEGLGRLVASCESLLFMELPDFRDLMELKLRRDHSDREWKRINHILESVGQQHDRGFHIPPTSKDFHHNLLAAVGHALDFSHLSDVENIYQLYAHRHRLDVQQFIVGLHFTLQDFAAMMQIKTGIDSQWTQINTLLQAAGQQKQGESFHLPYLSPEKDPIHSEGQATHFADNLRLALGTPAFDQASGVDEIDRHLQNIDDYHQALMTLEAYFFLLAEEFAYILDASLPNELLPPPPPPPRFMSSSLSLDSSSENWQIVDRLLTKAYLEKLGTARRKQIEMQGDLLAEVLFVLGEAGQDLDIASALEKLRVYIQSPADAELLHQVSQQEWDDVLPGAKRRVYEILERAESARQHFVPPPVQKEEWLNLYPATDATTVTIDSAIASGQKPWKTFGAPSPPPVAGTAPQPVIGWAVTSPLLMLGSGRRSLTLTLVCAAQSFDQAALTTYLSGDLTDDSSPLCLQASTTEGWLAPTSAEAAVGDFDPSHLTPELPAPPAEDQQPLKEIRLTLNWPEEADPIAPRSSPMAGAVASTWPILRLMLRPLKDTDDAGFHALYPTFRDLRLVALQLRVEVSGLIPQEMRNDDHPVDPGQPFEPFTDSPSAGSRWCIADPELTFKDLDRLSFDIQWMGAPSNLLTDYYKNYSSEVLNDIHHPGFTASLAQVDHGAHQTLESGIALFSADHIATRSVEIPLDPILARDLDTTDYGKHFEWQLAAPDFQHLAYPAVASSKAIEMAAAIARGEPISPAEAANYQVNPPYTPKIQSLKLGYGASLTLLATPNSDAADDARPDRMFHIHPFGYAALDPDPGAASEGDSDLGFPLLPSYDNEGELYIGLRDVETPQALSLFFQLDAGSADSDLPPESVQWSFLSANRWLDFGEGGITSDTTRGLINSGIIEFKLETTEPSTLLPGDLYWLRAAVVRHSASLCDTLAIHCQAVEAVFLDQGTPPDHYGQPLSAGSIESLVVERPQIAAVHQPYTSYGGRGAEPANLFDTRVSERLRHKDRALQSWDYERLVLSHFPEVYKVKCVPADLSGGDGQVFATPGTLRLVIIPDLRGQLPFAPFEPRASADLLASISDLLTTRCPVFASIAVQNAHFLLVKLRLTIHFNDPRNERFHINQLNNDLKRFLSPWAYREGADIVIGDRIYANNILDFVDRRPYVDFVEGLKLFTSLDGEHFTEVEAQGDGEYFVSAEQPDQVLVTAQQHQIIPFSIGGGLGGGGDPQTGIGHMVVNRTFVVA